MKQVLYIFVDHDNYEYKNNNLDIFSFIRNIIDSLDDNIKCYNSIKVRFYGGWYIDEKLTVKAHKVIEQCEKQEKFYKIPVYYDIAKSLLLDENIFLFNTYREKSFPYFIKIEDFSQYCDESDCLLKEVKSLFKKGKCPRCGKDIRQIIYYSQQKLVDTMMTCDLIHRSQQGDKEVVLVSSDDDFIPCMHLLLFNGTHVYHFNTFERRESISYDIENPQYHQY